MSNSSSYPREYDLVLVGVGWGWRTCFFLKRTPFEKHSWGTSVCATLLWPRSQGWGRREPGAAAGSASLQGGEGALQAPGPALHCLVETLGQTGAFPKETVGLDLGYSMFNLEPLCRELRSVVPRNDDRNPWSRPQLPSPSRYLHTGPLSCSLPELVALRCPCSGACCGVPRQLWPG